MYLHKRIAFLICVLIVLTALTGCQQAEFGVEANISPEEGADAAETATGIGETTAGMANPAAVYCEGLGYRMEGRENAAGMEAACIFPDGQECGQWDFLSGRCGREYSYCAQQNGVLQETETNIGTCVFEDGSTCDEYGFSLGECKPGDHSTEVSESSADAGLEEDISPEQAPGLLVSGWMGYVSSTPAGAQYDDFITVLPEGEVGEFGIEGASEAVSAQIRALRDHEQPGKYAHFWGRLTCEVMDYGGCQLLVERMRVDGPGEFFAPERVEGWEGSIRALSYEAPGASQPDDAFIPAGGYPVQYGIDSAISSESGERDLSERIANLRESGEAVRIWGEMVCGVPDAGGCRIEVWKIESGNEVYEITPVK